MHRSRLAGFIIDCQTDDLEGAAQFWSAALGYQLRPREQEASPIYREFATQPDDLHMEVQKVSHASRVHLDIEADDIDAEVRRLSALGAQLIERKERWCVMEAPTGQRFCVVRVQRAGFEVQANVWK